MAGDTAQEFYTKALKRHAELSLEIEALAEFIQAYERIMKKRAAAQETYEEQPDLYKPASNRAARALQIAEMVEATRRIIIAEGKPLKRGELVRRIEALGFEIVGTDKSKVFGTNLWRSNRFRTIEGKGYWPADLELPKESLSKSQTG